jgi:type IV pilus assembly protein PilQ
MARPFPPIRLVGLAGSLVVGWDGALAPALAQGWAGAPAPAPAVSAPPGRAVTRPVAPRAVPLELAVERRGGSLDVIITGVGASPQLQQSLMGEAWLGRLFVASPTRLRRGPQTLALPEAGIQSISLSGGGSQFDLQVRPVPGYPLGRPVVSADGTNLILSFAASAQASQQSYSRDLALPGRVPGAEMAPPLQPRAVAPPVGDMAVGSILIANSGFVNVSGPPITMTLQNASAPAVLMTLTRLGGYGFVYVNDSQAKDTAGQSAEGGAAASALPAPKISIAFRGENYARAINSVLLASGLQGKVEGSTLLAGPNVLGKGFNAKLSKVIRLNQVGANSAADYLANLGAQVSKTNTITTAVTQGVSQTQAVATSPTSATTQSSTTTRVEAYGATTGPLLGLQATTDSRLSTITLVGSPAVVAVAETYLRQLDLRQRQVALSVKILDVSLDNDRSIDNSFAFRYGNNFIVNDSGNLVGAFGSLLPPNQSAFNRDYPESIGFDITTSQETGTKITGEGPAGRNVLGGGQFGTLVPDPVASLFKDSTKRNPGLSYPRDNFFNYLKSVITSGSTKVLASPTLILSENSEELREGEDTLAVNISGSVQAGATSGSTSSSGDASTKATIGRTKANEAFVTIGEQQITSFVVQAGQNGAANTCQPVLGISGLTFGARVSKIDDNGFVTFSMSPSISATVGSTIVPGCGPIRTLAIRRLDTGSARVRDGQTLILTGVISDRDTEVVQKWPIMGDIPLIGQFFRNSSSNRAKRELVIMVTPRIIDDTEGGTWGYGYQPSSRDARRFMGTSTGQSPY